MIKKAFLTLMAGASLTIASHAQEYWDGTLNGRITIEQEPSLTELTQLNQLEARQDIVYFQRFWRYQADAAHKNFYLRAVPGLGAALKNNDWASAASFTYSWLDQEVAYEKHYHRPSAAYLAAYHAAFK